jgi:hypothetical protein
MNIGVRKTFVMPDGQEVTLETGKLAKQAHGSAVIRVGGTMLLAAVVSNEDAKEGVDFMPLTVEYQEKLLERSLKSDIGTCGYCDRYIEIENAVIYDHGFRIGLGFRNGVCNGARFAPFERSPEAKILLVKDLKANLKKIQDEKPTQLLVDTFNSDKFKYTQSDIDELIKKSSYAIYKKVGDYKMRQYFTLHTTYVITLEKLMFCWDNEIKSASRLLEEHETKLNNWKPVKTLREIATERLNLRKKVA